jgi:hypothetical protein
LECDSVWQEKVNNKQGSSLEFVVIDVVKADDVYQRLSYDAGDKVGITPTLIYLPLFGFGGRDDRILK